MNLFDNKIKDNGEIASEENNDENEKESENGANILIFKLNAKSVIWFYFLSRQEKMGFPYTMKWISRFVLCIK